MAGGEGNLWTGKTLFDLSAPRCIINPLAMSAKLIVDVSIQERDKVYERTRIGEGRVSISP
jgi:hypothetical protein